MAALSLTHDTPALAGHYERVSQDRQFKAGQALLERLALRAGESVLDVGAGTGLLAEYAAQVVGPRGSVVGLDPLPLRIEIASRKAKQNLTFRVGSADDLRAFADDTFDVVYLNAVFHWLPEKLGPLREFWRVLKPLGRLGITTGEKGRNTLRAIRREVLSREPYVHHADANDDVGHNVRPDELRALLKQTDFFVQELTVEPHTTTHPTASAAIEFAQASSFGNFLGKLPESLQQAARQEIERELEKLRTPQGIPQEGARIHAIAIKR